MDDPKGKTNSAWKRLFEEHCILQKIDKSGSFIISAEEIKKQREPRLMVKFDHANSRPKIFQDHEISILPVSHGRYLVSRLNVYHTLEPDTPGSQEIISRPLPDWIKSLDAGNVFSEPVAINCAMAAGIIHDFVGEDVMVATVSGRMRNNGFFFNIRDRNGRKKEISVSNVQIEIDAAYEGMRSLVLVEAKNNILQDDFIVRQLYYPFRTWVNRIQKTIRPVFLTFSNGVYTLREYWFLDSTSYNSIELVKQAHYSIKNVQITSREIAKTLNARQVVEDAAIPFPQANSFERVINLCELLHRQDMTQAEITENYGLVARQTPYHADAARYLGLVEKIKSGSEICYRLTETGRAIFKLDYKTRQLAFCRCIFSHAPFNILMRRWFASGEMPGKNEIVEVMKNTNVRGMESDETYRRRAGSVSSWLKWVVGLIDG